jgi:hypothetical protein
VSTPAVTTNGSKPSSTLELGGARSREVNIPHLANSDANEQTRSLFKRQMKLSMRNNSWFRLSLQERSLYKLALRLRIKLESMDLLRAMVSVLKKLQQMGRTTYNQLLTGTRLAWAFSEAACRWGNPEAKPWRHDQNYIRFLGFVCYKTNAG